MVLDGLEVLDSTILLQPFAIGTRLHPEPNTFLHQKVGPGYIRTSRQAEV